MRGAILGGAGRVCARACVCVCVSRVCSSRGCRARHDEAHEVVVARGTRLAAGAAGEGEGVGNAWRTWRWRVLRRGGGRARGACEWGHGGPSGKGFSFGKSLVNYRLHYRQLGLTKDVKHQGRASVKARGQGCINTPFFFFFFLVKV